VSILLEIIIKVVDYKLKQADPYSPRPTHPPNRKKCPAQKWKYLPSMIDHPVVPLNLMYMLQAA
jgi:hypothetical protein